MYSVHTKQNTNIYLQMVDGHKNKPNKHDDGRWWCVWFKLERQQKIHGILFQLSVDNDVNDSLIMNVLMIYKVQFQYARMVDWLFFH